MRRLSYLMAVALLASQMTPAMGYVQTQVKDDFQYEESFETSVEEWSAGWLRNEIGANNHVASIKDGYRGAGIQISIPKGSHKGSEMILPAEQFGGYDAEVAATTFWLRIDTPLPIESQGKFPGLIGPISSGGKGGNSCQGEVCWTGRSFYTACRNQDAQTCPTYQFGVYMYGPNQDNETGDFYFADHNVQLEPGKWHCFQTIVKMNDPGESNGIFMAFIDGQIEKGVTAYTMFREAGDNSGVRGFWVNFYEGGKEPAKQDMKFSFDELEISRNLVPQDGCLQAIPDLLADVISLSDPAPQAPPTTIPAPNLTFQQWFIKFMMQIVMPLLGLPKLSG